MEWPLLSLRFISKKFLFFSAFFIALIILINPVSVLAAAPAISNLSTSQTSNTVTISGTSTSEFGTISSVGYQIDATSSPFIDTTLANQIQAGNIDNSFFHGDGLGVGADTTVSATAIQPDGKIIIGGLFTTYNGVNVGHLARLNTSGSLDATFDTAIGANGNISALVIQSDGKIIIGGTFTSYDGTTVSNIARVNTDGSLDATFNPGGAGATGTGSTISSIVVQPDGKIIIGGTFTAYNGTTVGNIARLKIDGTIDDAFNPLGAGANGAVNTIALQSTNQYIIIAGNFTTYNGTGRVRVARLDTAGALDGTFTVGTGANKAVNTIAIQPADGYIIIGGIFTTYNSTAVGSIARLKTDGVLDTGFTSGTGFTGISSSGIKTIYIYPTDGKILVGGFFSAYNGNSVVGITRLGSNGIFDTSFNPGGHGTNSVVFSVSIQTDGKIIMGGQFNFYNGIGRNKITRLNIDGAQDTEFNVGLGTNGSVRAITNQPDGKIIIVGAFSVYNGIDVGHIARLNADGTLDTTFNPGGAGAAGSNFVINAVTLQSDGKILIGGNLFTSYNGVTINNIARLNADGTLDENFVVGTGLDGLISFHALVVQPDGKILVGGAFTAYNGVAITNIARLNADGTLDNGFNVGAGADGTVNAIVVQSDNKIIISGAFTHYAGTAINRIARLNADGTLDTGFNVGGAGAAGGSGSVTGIAIQSDGKIIIGGNTFTTYNGVTVNNIARLNINGTLDTSFNSGTGANGGAHGIIVQPDGRIIIGSSFTTYNDVPINRIARLNADGTLDTGFNVGAGVNLGGINSIAIQSDSKIIIGGGLSAYNSIPLNYLVRVNGNNSSAFSATISTAGLSAGSHTIYLKSTDSAANTDTNNYPSITFAIPDTTPPIITLLGTNPISIYQYRSYTDPGATANDNLDGDITSSITVVNPVNTSIPGTYTITYNLSDNATNPATQVTRTVNVLSIGSGLPSYAAKTPEQLIKDNPSTNENNSVGSTINNNNPISSLTINNNLSFITSNPQITLKFNNNNNPLITHLAISTTTDFTSSSLIDYTPSYSYNLCGTSTTNCPDGAYNIYAQYYTSYGQSSLAGPLIVILKKETSTLSVAPASTATTVSPSTINNLAHRLSGRILLQVESHGEAWYINPDNQLRYYLGRPSDAFNLMRKFGLGASTKDITSFQSSTTPKRLSGKILLQVEDKGQAYYVNPLDLKLYYLGRPSDAFNLMRSKGLGISDSDLEKMGAGN